MTKDAKGYYRELGVDFDANETEIKQNYREKAKKWHPDYNSGEEALEKFQKISVAYDVIKDEKSRLMYDLLSEVYDSQKFPDMFSLKVYKNQNGEEDVFVRTLSLKKKGKETKDVCSFNEARFLVLKNFLTGFWRLKDMAYNLKNIGNNHSDNLTLLVHNALAYEQENKKDKAAKSLSQALEYADPYQKKLINKYLYLLGFGVQRLPDVWNFKQLKLIYISIPSALLLAFVVPNFSKIASEIETGAQKTISYYQEVRFNTGGHTVDDMVVSKIVSMPIDTKDLNTLYHVIKNIDVKFAPSNSFDTITTLDMRHTVRITGFTPDREWYRVMLDNGDMGFVESKFLQKGIGSKIPDDSKIYTGEKI